MNFLIRITVSVFAAFLISVSSFAQAKDRQRVSREELAMLQAKHIAHDLAMDKTTGSRFIKTYCDFQKELWNLGPKPNGKSGFMADEEHERMIEKRFEHSQKILDLREKYYRKYSEFLTPSQISRVYELERKIVNKLRNNSRKARNRR